jgi:hypothetical protein
VSARRVTTGSDYAASAQYEFILKRRRSGLAFLIPRHVPRHSCERHQYFSPPSTSLSTAPSDCEAMDRQGAQVFALVSSRFANDTSRIRQFGRNLCSDQRPCILRFWISRSAGALSVPLTREQQGSEVAEFSIGELPHGTVVLFK